MRRSRWPHRWHCCSSGLLLKNWLLVGLGGAGALGALLLWLWPRRSLLEREPARG